MGSIPTRARSVRGRKVYTLDKYSKWLTESRPDLLIRVNGSYNVVEQL